MGTRSQLFRSKSSENIERRPKTLRFQVLKVGPSDWIRTSGRPTASPGRPCGEIEIQEAAGSRALAKKERQVLVIPVFLGPSDWIRTSGLLNPIALRGLKKCYFTRGCGPANPHGCSLFYKKSITTETADKWILF